MRTLPKAPEKPSCKIDMLALWLPKCWAIWTMQKEKSTVAPEIIPPWFKQCARCHENLEDCEHKICIKCQRWLCLRCYKYDLYCIECRQMVLERVNNNLTQYDRQDNMTFVTALDGTELLHCACVDTACAKSVIGEQMADSIIQWANRNGWPCCCDGIGRAPPSKQSPSPASDAGSNRSESRNSFIELW